MVPWIFLCFMEFFRIDESSHDRWIFLCSVKFHDQWIFACSKDFFRIIGFLLCSLDFFCVHWISSCSLDFFMFIGFLHVHWISSCSMDFFYVHWISSCSLDFFMFIGFLHVQLKSIYQMDFLMFNGFLHVQWIFWNFKYFRIASKLIHISLCGYSFFQIVDHLIMKNKDPHFNSKAIVPYSDSVGRYSAVKIRIYISILKP